MRCNFSYTAAGEKRTSTGSNDDFTLDIRESDDGLKVTLIPTTPISDISFWMERDYAFGEDSRFFANGFQSWTDSKEFTAGEIMPGLGLVGRSPFGKKFGLKYVGDYTFTDTVREPGHFHAISFAYVRNGDDIDLMGSLNDRTGYTIIYADMVGGTIRYSKDLEGLTIDAPYDVLDMFFARGSYDFVFDRYFYTMGITPRTDKKIKGYTSWYNYYQNISADIILRDLASLAAESDVVNTFQIDDGYQTAVGDWLSINSKKFPDGMRPIADEIHKQGLNAGLWLAPFGAQRGSRLAAEHPDWLIKDSAGKPITVGANWGGFYALDIYNDNARDYIKRVFDTVLNEWGFDLVKLDFLYAASIVPMRGKTRGEIAYDSIDLLRECVGDKMILGCGVQQMPCYGKVEYMRIGPDMSLGWRHTLLRRNMHREDVSTPNAIHNSVYRRCLNGRAFLCDPDVFLLRRTNIKFTPDQQMLLAKFIKLFGNVLFMSDNVADYDDQQMATFRNVMADDAHIVAVNENNNQLFIDYAEGGKPGTLRFNVQDGTIY